jgi:flavodoxin
MKILITYYSRTNITEKIAKTIQTNLDCDIEEIIDLKNRSGPFGWIKSCIDAIRQNSTDIKSIEKDPSDYDLVIIGTPVWASTMASGVLTYLKENKEKFNDVAFFCTCGSSGYDETFSKMEEIAGKKAIETLFITKEDLNTSFDSKIQSYTGKLNQS